jgi:hypothetical protein
MLSNIQTLRPGLLVSLKSSVSGNAQYIPHDRQVRIDSDGKEITEIETTRVIADPKEFKRAGEARSKARSIISSVCAKSNFGLLCPEKDRDALDKAIADARKVVEAFNATATLTNVNVYAIIGHIASDDVEAVRGISSEISDLLGRMEAGLKNLDVKAIRKAANEAKNVGQMLTPEAATRVQMAIDTARSAARKITKAGETAAAEIDLRAIRKVTEARTAFLDLGEAAEVAAPRQTARALDLTPSEPVKAGKAKARSIEL